MGFNWIDGWFSHTTPTKSATVVHSECINVSACLNLVDTVKT